MDLASCRPLNEPRLEDGSIHRDLCEPTAAPLAETIPLLFSEHRSARNANQPHALKSTSNPIIVRITFFATIHHINTRNDQPYQPSITTSLSSPSSHLPSTTTSGSSFNFYPARLSVSHCHRSAPYTATIGGSQALAELVVRLQQHQQDKQLMLLDHLTDAADYYTYHTAMSSNFFSQSPTVVLPPQAPDQYFANSHYGGANGTAPAINGISPNGLSNANQFTPTASTPTASTPGSSLAGRKRSRGDIYTEDDDGEDERLDGSTATPIEEDLKKPRGKPVYGPGMTILYPEDPGYAMAAESQSVTWVEEGVERRPFQMAHAKRPSVTSRKSQRMNSKAAGPDDLAQLVLPASMREACAEPLIDEATRVLGISWVRMDSTEALQINKRAYSKWIQNHYPCLKDVDVWFESNSIPGYLVHGLNAYNGQHEYYIFSHDLTEARLVTNEPSQLLPRLQMLPALHLAAPGGHIRAETDPITAAQNEANDIQADMVAMHGAREPVGICGAHAMELD